MADSKQKDERQTLITASEDAQNRTKTRQMELDDFWNIDRLVPASASRRIARERASRPSRTTSPAAVEMELPPRSATHKEAHTACTEDTPLTIWEALSKESKDAPAAGTVEETMTNTAPDTASGIASEVVPRTASGTPLKTVPYATTETVSSPGAVSANIPAGIDVLPMSTLGQPHFVPPHTAKDGDTYPPEDDYAPDGFLLHRVQVYHWRSNYHYFDQFSKDVEVYAAMEPDAKQTVRREPFFSFFPQYAQLSRRQLAWYVAWRAQVRSGVYPECDYAYILLYLFELINLPVQDTTDGTAARTRDRMADVWMAYRKSYPQLDHYMCEWLCDYCLIHRLNAPVDRLAPALDDIVKISLLKEFYLAVSVGAHGKDMESARILLRHCCQYDYHKSKFAQGEHAALFDRIIPGAIAAVLPLLLGRHGQSPLIQLQDSIVTRDAYVGALCAYKNKRRMTVSYTSFSHAHELRFLIGDMVKHVENRLRGWIGVRSRLSTVSLPPTVREALDAYLKPLTPAQPTVAPTRKPAPIPAYEAQYDSLCPDRQVSLAEADAIEKASWHTTRILTEAFGTLATDTQAPFYDAPSDSLPKKQNAEEETHAHEPGQDVTGTSARPDTSNPAMPRTPSVVDPTILTTTSQTPSMPLSAAMPPASNAAGSLAEALGSLGEFVRLALVEDGAGQAQLARRLHAMPDALADKINGITVDAEEIGDVILEDRGDGTYRVLEEYMDILKQALGDATTGASSGLRGEECV